MKSARIVCPGDDLHLSGKNIHGKIALCVGDVSFPSEDWTDFVVVLLGSWCTSVSDLLSRKVSEARVLFMDGPYEAQVQTSSHGWRLTLVERRSSGNHVHEPEWVTSSDLIDSVIEASHRVLAASDKCGWKTDDVGRLARSAAVLTKVREGLS